MERFLGLTELEKDFIEVRSFNSGNTASERGKKDGGQEKWT